MTAKLLTPLQKLRQPLQRHHPPPVPPEHMPPAPHLLPGERLPIVITTKMTPTSLLHLGSFPLHPPPSFVDLSFSQSSSFPSPFFTKYSPLVFTSLALSSPSSALYKDHSLKALPLDGDKLPTPAIPLPGLLGNLRNLQGLRSYPGLKVDMLKLWM